MRHYHFRSIKTLILKIVLVATILGVCSARGLAQHVPTDNFYSIWDLNKNNFSSGTYTTEGYVVKIYQCPVCREKELCKPCMGNNIIISEKNKLLNSYKVGFSELIIFSDDVSQFKLGEKYRFLFQMLDAKTTSQITNNVKLVYFEKATSGK